MTVTIERMDAYRPLAEEVLDAFERIAGAARERLSERRGSPLDALASVNQATAEKVVKRASENRKGNELDWRRLVGELAIARLVVVDENGRNETLYVARGGTVDPTGIRLCSYLSPKGALASLAVGDGRELALPGGRRWFEVLERATFSPKPGQLWDARPAVIQDAAGRPTTIRSLLELLREAATGDPFDAYDQFLAGRGSDEANVFEGVQRGIQTAMQLRVTALLDAAQSDVFRLPIDTRMVLLGPAGTGKTTTLIKRLRQKIDWQHLDGSERTAVGEENATAHPTSWLMFTPTDLLKRYVQDAINKEDVPAPDGRIQTWFDFRRELARRHLPILRSGSGAGMTMRDGLGILAPAALVEAIAWFEAFDAFQSTAFVTELSTAARRLSDSGDVAVSTLGARAADIIARHSGQPLALMAELANLFDILQREVARLRDATRTTLRQPLALHFRRDRDAMDALARFVSTLSPEADDASDDADADGEDEDDELVSPGGRVAAEAAFVRALRARAVAQARRRALGSETRAARVLAWATERGIELPLLDEVGQQLLVQRAASRLLRAPNLYLRRMASRYRQFRRAVQPDGRWYSSTVANSNDADPLEVDLVVLALLRGASAMRRDGVLIRRMADRTPALIDTVEALKRHQILVDEATDFSPVQLACMAQLARSGLDSFCASGDFNQRLTLWGSRSPSELAWLYPDIRIERVDVAYRQSRRLTEFATALVTDKDGEAPRMPDYVENDGVAPVLGRGLADAGSVARWLGARIREVEHLSGTLPTIAVLVNSAADLEPLAVALNVELADMNIRAIACPGGQAIGPEGDVRIFEAEHIKGLQFEAIILLDVDRLASREPDLFDRYLYVGATRAATYLGLTCAGEHLPAQLETLAPLLAMDWRL